MADPITIIDPIITLLQTVLSRVEVLVGGVFGLYLILIVYKIYDMKKQKDILQDLRDDIADIKRQLVIKELKVKHENRIVKKTNK